MVNLEFLQIQNFQNLKGTAPSDIGVMKNLIELNIFHTGITEPVPSSICDSKSVNTDLTFFIAALKRRQIKMPEILEGHRGLHF
jgi:hypothetical protein